MTREKFLDEIKRLHDEVNVMGKNVLESLKTVVEAVIESDEDLAHSVIERDTIIDNMERDIEEKALKLVALQQPMARDLRDIFTTTKVVTDLERIGDLAVDLAKISLRLNSGINKQLKEKILKMVYSIENMLEGALKSYFENDTHMAKIVSRVDDEIDERYIDMLTTLREYGKKYPEKIEDISQIMFINKFLERIGDHITNICEWTFYSVKGELIDLNK